MVSIASGSFGPFETNGYLLLLEKEKQAIAIDVPPGSLDWYLSSPFPIRHILLTHSHQDHIGDVKALKEKTQGKVYIHPLDAPNLHQPGADGLPLFFPCPGCQEDYLLEEGETLSIGQESIQVLHLPGHSPGSCGFYLPKHSLLFSGDVLFQGTYGRVDFPHSNPAHLRASLKRLAALPPPTQVYPGHGDSTTLKDESYWILNPPGL